MECKIMKIKWLNIMLVDVDINKRRIEISHQE